MDLTIEDEGRLWRMVFEKPTMELAISYGTVPAGSRSVGSPEPPVRGISLLVRFSMRDNDEQVAAGDFILSGLKPDKVLMAQGSLGTLDPTLWRACQQ